MQYGVLCSIISLILLLTLLLLIPLFPRLAVGSIKNFTNIPFFSSSIISTSQTHPSRPFLVDAKTASKNSCLLAEKNSTPHIFSFYNRICLYNVLTKKLGLEPSNTIKWNSYCSEGTFSFFSVGFLPYGEQFNYTGLNSVHTTLRAHSLQEFSKSAHYTILILNEPPRVSPFLYEFIRESPVRNEVSLIVHHGAHSDLPFSNAFSWPIIESWIPINQWGLHKKEFSCSMIASAKRGPGGYDLRGAVIDAIISRGIDCDIFGGQYQSLNTKDAGLVKYQFSIVIENSRSEGRYFTEKLLDPLAVGTVPLYWGTDFAVRAFGDAIVPWQTIDELLDILSKLTPEYYAKFVPALQRARPMARWFASPENFLWDFCISCALSDVQLVNWFGESINYYQASQDILDLFTKEVSN